MKSKIEPKYKVGDEVEIADRTLWTYVPARITSIGHDHTEIRYYAIALTTSKIYAAACTGRIREEYIKPKGSYLCWCEQCRMNRVLGAK